MPARCEMYLQFGDGGRIIRPLRVGLLIEKNGTYVHLTFCLIASH